MMWIGYSVKYGKMQMFEFDLDTGTPVVWTYPKKKIGTFTQSAGEGSPCRFVRPKQKEPEGSTPLF